MEKTVTAAHVENGTVQQLCVHVVGECNGREGINEDISSLLLKLGHLKLVYCSLQ